MKSKGGKDARLVVDRSVKGVDGFNDEERDKRVQEVRFKKLHFIHLRDDFFIFALLNFPSNSQCCRLHLIQTISFILMFSQVVSDRELSSLLLDPVFQQTLKECNDPLMYSMHMRNPDTARKIKLMFNAGLVATVK